MLYIASLCQRCKQPFTFVVTVPETPRVFSQRANKAARSKRHKRFSLSDPTAPKPVANKTPLSFREALVYRLRVEGLNREQIAERMKVSQITVSNAQYQVCQKLGIHNSVEAILRFANSPKPASLPKRATVPALPSDAGVFEGAA